MEHLSRLVGDVDRFIHERWEQTWSVHHNAAMTTLFGIEAADRLLTSQPLAAPHFARIARHEPGGESAAPGSRYREIQYSHGVEGLTVLDPVEALRAFDEGHSLVFHSLRRLNAEVAAFVHQLQGEVGHRIGCNAYLTPSGSQALAPHYDTHDVFVVQTFGSKQWELWPATVALPTPLHCPEQLEPTGEPERVTLHAGDVLYLPRGMPHRAWTTESASLHATVAVHAITQAEVAHQALLALNADDAACRKSLPLGFHRDPLELEATIKGIVTDVASRMEEVALSPRAEELIRGTRSSSRVEAGRLVDLADPGSAGAECFGLGAHAARLSKAEGRWHLDTGESGFDLPDAVTAAVDRLMNAEQLSRHEIVPGVSEPVADVLIAQRGRHGVISAAR